MTLEQLKASVNEFKVKYHELNYFYYDELLSEFEIGHLKLAFPNYKFGSHVSQSGFVMMANKDSKYVEFSLPKSSLDSYIEHYYDEGL